MLSSFSLFNKRKNKKGALTQQQLIGIILLVVGFVILLIFIGSLALKGEIGNQVCHFTVVMRGTLPEIKGVSFKESIPLKCKTDKICVTAGDDCGRYDYSLKKISGSEEEQKEEIKSILAREMVRCWSMMGEGKIQIFDKKVIDNEKKGVICSRVMFDESVDVEEIPLLEMIQFLFNHGISEDESYWDMLSDEGAFTKDKEYMVSNLLKENPVVNLNKERSILFVQVIPSNVGKLFGAGGGLLVGAKVGGAFGTFLGPGGTIIGAIGGAAVGWFGADAVEEKLGKDEIVSGVQVTEYSADALRDSGVTSLENIA